MKRIIYQVVVAKTSEDNELWKYETVFRSPIKNKVLKFAAKHREEHPDYAFIVAEARHETKTEWGTWEINHEAGGEEVLEHY